MDKPILNKVNIIEPLEEQGYDRYMPSAYNNAFSMVQKINLALNKLNEIGGVANDTVAQWNEVMDWVMNDGLTDDVVDKLNLMLSDGTFEDLMNNSLFRDYNGRLTVAENKINGAASGSPKGVYATTTALTNAFPAGNTNIYVVNADGGWYYWNDTLWVKGGSYLANPISDWSVEQKSLKKQRAEIVEMGGSILIDNGATPNVIFNADSTNRSMYAMAGGIARQIIIPSSVAYVVAGDPALGISVVQYLVIDNTGAPLFKRYSLIADDDFVVGILYGNHITLYYNQYNGFYETGEVLANMYVKWYRHAKKLLIPKGLQITKNQKSYYVSTTHFFDVVETDVAKYYVLNKQTLDVSQLTWADTAIMSQKYIVFGFTFRGKVYLYGAGYLQDSYYMKKGWTNDSKKMVQRSIKNPFVRSNVKLLGDSITAGVGGTGYSLTGATMFTDTDGVSWNENISTATCWSNMLKTLLSSYGGLQYAEPFHESFYWSATPGYVTEGSLSKSFMSYRLNQVGDYVAFAFYGDTCNINFNQSSACGIINIYIDGVLNTTFDGYNAAVVWNVSKNITGLTKAYHTCVIEISAGKNANSTGNILYFNGVTFNKEISVKNWGASGVTSQWVFDNITNLVQSTDDIFLLQIGTNDRKLSTNWQLISMFQRQIVETILKQGSDVIIMTANSGTTDNENGSSRLFNSNRVGDENLKVALEYNLPYISNYNAFLDYMLLPTALYTDIMSSDGTHPNDKGYRIMFRNICKETGLNQFIGNV
jgi:lysophospholipase L1-like esterase